jgi:hypothetical protein
MKEVKASLGNFETLNDLRTFLEEDNERPYKEKGYRRKLGIHKVRSAFVKQYNRKVWVYSRGYGLEFVFTEKDKELLVN